MEVMKYPKPADILPHEDPIVMVDEIVNFEGGEYLEGKKTIEPDSIYMQGHFPGQPIFPGVMLIEMMFQACGLYVRMERERTGQQNSQGAGGRAIKIEKAVFKKEALPNDVLSVKVSFKNTIMNFSTFDAKVVNQNEELIATGRVVVFVER